MKKPTAADIVYIRKIKSDIKKAEKSLNVFMDKPLSVTNRQAIRKKLAAIDALGSKLSTRLNKFR